MTVAEILKSIADGIQSNASAKSVYGAPVSVADRTVIPVARIRYGFGGGGGSGHANTGNRDRGGGGGGGHVSAAPAGFIEITSDGTRFTPIPDWRKTVALVAVSLGVGFIAGKRSVR